MSVYGFNEKLEKVPIVRLSKTLSCAARTVTNFEWDSTALAAAGVKVSELAYYEVVSISFYFGSSAEIAKYRYTNLSGFSSGDPAYVSSYPSATIDTYSDKVSASYYSTDAAPQTVTMRVTLMKVA